MSQVDRTNFHAFMKGSFIRALRKDLESFKLVRESDVECAAYMHIRRYLSRDPSWTVLARRHVPRTGHYVDLVIFERNIPRAAIEIKWGRATMDAKDRKSLNTAITELGVNKAYWISASVLGERKNPVVKTRTEEKALFQLFVRANLDEAGKKKWAKVRDGFRSKMRTGTSGKRSHRPADDAAL